jgi:hypothetical protein
MARPGRPSFSPTETQRRQVLMASMKGYTIESIAALMEVTIPTLRKYFFREIKRGRELGAAENTNNLQAAAKEGNVTAMIWLDKTRFGVRDASEMPKRMVIAQQAQVADEGTEWQGLLR